MDVRVWECVKVHACYNKHATRHQAQYVSNSNTNQPSHNMMCAARHNNDRQATRHFKLSFVWVHQSMCMHDTEATQQHVQFKHKPTKHQINVVRVCLCVAVSQCACTTQVRREATHQRSTTPRTKHHSKRWVSTGLPMCMYVPNTSTHTDLGCICGSDGGCVLVQRLGEPVLLGLHALDVEVHRQLSTKRTCNKSANHPMKGAKRNNSANQRQHRQSANRGTKHNKSATTTNQGTKQTDNRQGSQ